MAVSQLHPLPRFRTQFVEGLARPSAHGLLGTLLVVILLVIGCACCLTRHLLAHHPEYLAGSGPADESTWITAETLRICEEPPQELSVTIIGNSAVRDAITDETDLSARLSQLAGRRVDVHLLAAGRIDLWNIVCLSDAICGHARGLAVLQISPYDLATDAETIEKPRLTLGLDSAALDDELRRRQRRPPGHCGIYFFSQYRFFAAREGALANLWQPAPQWVLHPARAPRLKDSSRGPALTTILDEQLRTYWNCADQNMQVYQRTIGHLRRDGGLGVALLEMPTNPRTTELMFHDPQRPQQQRLYARYLLDRQSLGRDAGVPIFDLAEEAGLEAGDFKDYTHLGGPEGQNTAGGRERYSQALARHLGPLLPAARF